MITEITLNTDCYLTIFFCETCDLESAHWRDICPSLQRAIDVAEFIFTTAYPHTAERVVICSVKTGEVLAECKNEPEDYDDDWQTWDDDPGPDSCDDWNYNEDMGFDPYLGCYTDDC